MDAVPPEAERNGERGKSVLGPVQLKHRRQRAEVGRPLAFRKGGLGTPHSAPLGRFPIGTLLC